MPELGSLEAGQAANLAGLAPIARQSGGSTGRSFIRGARADVRQALYMPALVLLAMQIGVHPVARPALVRLRGIVRSVPVALRVEPKRTQGRA
jgi:transposase